MNSLELLVGTTKDAIGAGYPDSKAANMLNATSDKIDDLIALHNHKEEIKDKIKQEEDVLSYALFPQVALKFFEQRDHQQSDTPKADTGTAAKTEEGGVRTLYVEDLSR